MPGKPQNSTPSFTFRLPVEERRKLEAMKGRRQTLSALIMQILDEYIAANDSDGRRPSAALDAAEDVRRAFPPEKR